jgi:class 3 adenylate cyclase
MPRISISHASKPGIERKVATVVFVDLVNSTSLVSRADPEVVRERVSRYFEVVSGSIEKHGGTVEKFAGDAVMAAFGVLWRMRTTRSARCAPRSRSS